MTADSVITDKEALHKAPPDILLTNYKQLDYLLIQPHVQNLWEHNQAGVLRYLVVDEFHTFDGAQGTDLACLIRRLRDRLQCPSDDLVCVGTSATLGGPESRETMLDYAGQIFASSFEPTSLIEEERLKPEEFFTVHTAFGDPDDGGLFALPLPGVADQAQLDQPMPEALRPTSLSKLSCGCNPGRATGRRRQRSKLATSTWLAPRHTAGRSQPSAPSKDTCSIDELLERFSKQLGLGERYPLPYRVLLLESLLALISHARRTATLINGKEILVPWVNLRQQLWLRELKRMVASVEEQPQLRHSDDLAGSEASPPISPWCIAAIAEPPAGPPP